MANQRGICIGGPSHGAALDAADTPAARNQQFIVLKNGIGEAFMYRRDPNEYPDGVVRWIWIDDTTPIEPEAASKQEGEGDTTRLSVEVKHDAKRNVHQLTLDGVVVDERRNGPAGRLEAEAWVREFVDGDMKLVQAKEGM